MSVVVLSAVLAAALGLVALVLNHCQARLALVELTLNEGLPPGYEPAIQSTPSALPMAEAAGSLGDGVHIFLSRTCHACHRLIQELDQTDLAMSATVHLHYVDNPRPIARAVAARLGASLAEHQRQLAADMQADPLPYTIAVGSHALVSRAVSPTVAQVLRTARDAGLPANVSTSA